MISGMLLLGIDVGTTGVKAAVISCNGEVLSKGYVEYEITTPRPGWSEQDPEMWWRATIKCVKDAVENVGASSEDISCVGLSGQTNGVVCIDKKGTLLRPCIIWMDRRSAKEAQSIEEKIGAQEFHEITGVLVDAFYSICKILWIKNNESKIFRKTQAILQPKDYIAFRLTGRKVLDIALASCTGMLDTRSKMYAESLLRDLGIPIDKLPELVNPDSVIGEMTVELAKEFGIPAGIPIVAGSGDVMVNALGSGAIAVGQAYVKTATVSDIVVTVGKPVLDPKFRFATYLHPVLDKWLLIGGATGGGLCYRWFRDTFGQLEKSISDDLGKDAYELMNEEAETVKANSEGLIFLPYLEGVRSPIWDAKARGVYFGITSKHRKPHFIRAILEGVAYSLRHRLDLMQDDLNVQTKEMISVGGGGKSHLWRQIIANVCNKPVLLTKGEEQECLGAAILAGRGTGVYSSFEDAVRNTVSISDKNEPDVTMHKDYDKSYLVYVSLYDKLKEAFRQLS